MGRAVVPDRQPGLGFLSRCWPPSLTPLPTGRRWCPACSGMIAVNTQAGFPRRFRSPACWPVRCGSTASLWKPPRALAGIMPVLVLPLTAPPSSASIMFLILGQPLAAATTGLTNWLNGLSKRGTHWRAARPDGGLRPGEGRVRFRRRRPVDRSETALMIMAAVMAAGMTPPLSLAHGRPEEPVHRRRAENGWPPGCWAPVDHRGRDPFAAADPPW
ncbi:hypothetical protein HBB16_11165 [Pseudonocardia sp. MCCB 268]|nr:hypothetical protein [Pseudonocardia cytotoxica]